LDNFVDITNENSEASRFCVKNVELIFVVALIKGVQT